jgi:hypothetical protein
MLMELNGTAGGRITISTHTFRIYQTIDLMVGVKVALVMKSVIALLFLVLIVASFGPNPELRFPVSGSRPRPVCTRTGCGTTIQQRGATCRLTRSGWLMERRCMDMHCRTRGDSMIPPGSTVCHAQS